MLKRFSALVVVLALSGCATSTPPLNTAKTLIVEAIDTLHQFSLHKELKNYKQFMDDAAGVVILPEVIKAGWITGAEAGNGVLLARRGTGWSDPTFHTLAAASVGLQFGVQDTAIIMILRNQGALQSILKHQGKIGADIGATVAFFGVGAEAATTSNLGADIVAFAAPNVGVYMGGSFEGSVLVTRRDINEAVYGAGATPNAVIAGKLKTSIADPLKDALGR